MTNLCRWQRVLGGEAVGGDGFEWGEGEGVEGVGVGEGEAEFGFWRGVDAGGEGEGVVGEEFDNGSVEE